MRSEAGSKDMEENDKAKERTRREKRMEQQEICLKRRGEQPVLALRKRAGVPYLAFPALEKIGVVLHGFSTRLGGVSQGDCATMNFARNRGDAPENIRENYRRMAAALDFDPEQMILSQQTHSVHIRRVTQDDAGKGYSRELDYRDIDGLMTDVPGLVLVTSYADCVPLLFVDPVRRAAAASHSGWRGTVARMGLHTVEAMKEAYGCAPDNLLVGIGPSICPDCYEVGEDVAQAFRDAFCLPQTSAVLRPNKTAPDHYFLNLQEAKRQIIIQAGVRPEHIFVSDVCTCCNKELLFSHRGSRGRRGNMGAFLGLRSGN